MNMIIHIYLFYFAFKGIFSSFLNKEEKEIALKLINTLEIRQCIFVSDEDISDSVKAFSADNKAVTNFGYDEFISFVLKKASYIEFSIGIVFKETNLSQLERISLMFNNKFPFFRHQTSQFTWLVFLDSEVSRTHWLNLKIPYDCEFIIIQKANRIYKLIEFYTLKEKSFFYDFGEWSDGLKITNVSMYWRRLNLNGTKITSFNNEFMLKTNEIRNMHRQCKILIHDFSRIMNFEDYQTEGRMFNVKYDILNVPIYNVEYQASPSVIGPVFKIMYSWYIKYPSKELRPDYYLQPFEMALWLTIFGLVITGSTIILFMHKIHGEEKRTFIDDLFLSVETLCNQSGNDEMNNFSSRFASLAFRVFAIFMIASFGGVITSYLAVEIPQIPFRSINEFMDDKNYKLIIFKGSTMHKYLENNNNDQMAYLWNNRTLLYINYRTQEQNLRSFCENESLATPFENYFLERMNLTCAIYRIPQPIAFAYYILVLNLPTPFWKAFNLNLIRVYEYGIHKKMQDILYDRPIQEKQEESFRPIEMQQMVQVLSIPLFGVGLAVTLLVGELIYKFTHLKRVLYYKDKFLCFV